ncbi:phosphoketolase family protein [Paramicrobacterium agarici]|uniref:Xylulose-5-phosphate/fructose-6-phosphate phosphoketolase n=1 Tax=Paramicrobacterium agarici TaxID=630514 RepID=A0A2A9DXG4_9MICO|nr:phosphoketolase family protein [Microbacterium agarici]PFG30682.1 xylulose-5-phosphate/fructose-6-phosphate phosphoketolase [Microbacterium agarici]
MGSLSDNHTASSQPADDLELVDLWWRAANYLSAGQIYLQSNPLLREPLEPENIKPRLLGHWGTAPGLNLVYAHLNRIIVQRQREMLYICGPGHGGAAMMANAWLDGTYSELEPSVGLDGAGLEKLLRQFSYPGGIPSHAAPEVPGSINEGGELGYSLMHAYGAILDNPDLTVACVIGDGEAETGPLAASWRAHNYIDPAKDGAVLPILHLNGYKIANPTPLARIPSDELISFFHGQGYDPLFIDGVADAPHDVHPHMAQTFDRAFDRIHEIQSAARNGTAAEREARWPVIILRTPKGWTGPEVVDGTQVEGTYHSHQVPLPEVRENSDHRAQLETWLRSYKPEELFSDDGAPTPRLDPLRPEGPLRMSASPETLGGIKQPLELPDLAPFAVETTHDPVGEASATRAFGEWLAELIRVNSTNMRLFGPDEVESNRLAAVFDVTNRSWASAIHDDDTHLAPHGQVIEALSEHLMQGMLEGYLLTGRHGLLTSYEAFIHIVDSMFNQHAKWLEASRNIDWRQPIASLNYLLSSHVWRQDHNGFSHQDPGFLNVVVNKKPEIVRIYLPPDANTLLVTMRHVFDTHDRVNTVVAGKQPQPAWLSLDEATQHVNDGLSIWPWASYEPDLDLQHPESTTPDAIIACAGDVPTIEAVAAAELVHERFPDLTLRLINVVDLMRLYDPEHHSHGLPHDQFNALFTTDRPVIFAFHGYPSLIHLLTYKRANHAQLHVHGFKERGTTTTPFDMVNLNDLDRYELASDVVRRIPDKPDQDAADAAIRDWQSARADAQDYAYSNGEDPPHITGWEFHRH